MRDLARIWGRWALVSAMHARLAAANREAAARPGNPILRILVVRPDHLGDLLFATPALGLLRKAFPEAHITGMVGPWGRSIWEGNSDLDALQTLPFPGIASRSQDNPLAPYRMIGKAARSLAREQYDLGILLRFDHWWGAALLWAAGIPRRWGYNTPGTRPWLTTRVVYRPGNHEVTQDLRLAWAAASTLADQEIAAPQVNRYIGEPPLRPPRPVPPPEGVGAGWLAAPHRAIIHPGTGAANKLWTIAGWAEIADNLAAEGWAMVLTGGPAETALTEAIQSASNSRPANLAGQTADLGQLAWLLDKADMVLGVDSGPLHIAAALDRPTLHLYGPSDETIWGPWGDPRLHRAYRAPGTRPTMRLDVLSHDLEGDPDMQAITPEMVMDQVRQLESHAVEAR